MRPATRGAKVRPFLQQQAVARSNKCIARAGLQTYELVALAAAPVVKVAALCTAGGVCARQGLLPPEGR